MANARISLDILSDTAGAIVPEPSGSSATHSNPKAAVVALVNFLVSCIGGARKARNTFQLRTAATRATATVDLITITTAQAVTITIDGVAFTDTTHGGDEAAAAATLAAAINASSNARINHIIEAAASTTHVVVTCKVPGYVGNAISIAVGGAGGGSSVVNGSLSKLAGGAETYKTFTLA